MSNYEIMILTNPKTTDEELQNLVFSVLDKNSSKFERLERNETAYPIKKLTHVNYFLITTKAEPHLMSELTRKLNIDKSVLRSLIINLDSEKGLKPRKVSKKFNKRIPLNRENKKPYVKNNETSKDASEEKKVARKSRTSKVLDEKK
ncbi:30S ribosomal protein S6 [Metamycoplasma hominis]|uniref:30S ribosomal protein S6 n=1 Tax=Metamycoplasma hominis TaxID=2098 RepID=UPI0034A358C5